MVHFGKRQLVAALVMGYSEVALGSKVFLGSRVFSPCFNNLMGS